VAFMGLVWPSMAYLSIQKQRRNLAFAVSQPSADFRPGETEIPPTMKAWQRIAAPRSLINPADSNLEPLGQFFGGQNISRI